MRVGCVDAPVSIGLNSGIDSASVGETIFQRGKLQREIIEINFGIFSEFFE